MSNSVARKIITESRTSVPVAANLPRTKTLSDVKADMSELYEQVKAGSTDLKLAAELANITGKFLKAEQLEMAKEIFLSNNPGRLSHG
jgi:hypothetical protein